MKTRPTAIRAGIPAARAIATYSAVCSLQSPTFVRSTSRADGGLLVEQRVDVARQLFRAVPRAGGAADRRFRFGANLRRVAFDERLGREISLRRRISGLGLKLTRIAQLDEVAVDALIHAVQV